MESNEIKNEKEIQKSQEEVSNFQLNAYNSDLYLMNLIFDNCIDELQQMALSRRDLNFLIEYKHIPIDLKISPLILASYLGRFDIVRMFLLNPLIDVDLGSDDSGFTALMVACMSGYYEIANLLITYGADVNKQNKQQQIPLQFCFSRLEEDQNHFENKRICMKLAELLFENGAEIDHIANQKKGYTMLMVFCSVKYKLNKREQDVNLSMIKFLLEHGASKKLVSRKNKTVFDLAQKHDNKEQVINILQNTNQKYHHDNLSNQSHILQNPIKEQSCVIETTNIQSKQQCCNMVQWINNLFQN